MVKRLLALATVLVTFCTSGLEPAECRDVETVGPSVERQCVPPDCDDSCWAS